MNKCCRIITWSESWFFRSRLSFLWDFFSSKGWLRNCRAIFIYNCWQHFSSRVDSGFGLQAGLVDSKLSLLGIRKTGFSWFLSQASCLTQLTIAADSSKQSNRQTSRTMSWSLPFSGRRKKIPRLGSASTLSIRLACLESDKFTH